MTEYRAPLREMQFLIEGLCTLGEDEGLQAAQGPDPDLVEAILGEASRWSEDVLVPLYRFGDLKEPELRQGRVRIPEEVKAAYGQFIDGGWCGLAFEEKWGGQGLGNLVSSAVGEIWKSANLGFSNCPMLTQAAAHALNEHGSDELKARFLPRLVSGEWAGTMNLTEPQAGSDLAAVRAIAEPEGGHYRLRGKKIFITWGDQDLTENIVHLVLARTPDAPPGVKGLSLFLVPKCIPGADGEGSEPNEVTTVSIEDKLGLHGSPTCVLSYGDDQGSVAYLVGRVNAGLACMFTMMNRARLSVGVEGMALAERAYQKALGYARERVQGRPPGHGDDAPIFHYPDVRRMLMMMKASIEAMRALAYRAALHADVAERAADEEAAERARTRLSILTPIIKGWCTELGQEMVSLGVQVHGGMGYIEETGAAQILRDARITTIYEGTTGIQANDLIGRKLIHDEAAAIRALLGEVEAMDPVLAEAGEAFMAIRSALSAASAAATEAVDYILSDSGSDPALPGAVAVNFLMLMGTLLGGWQLARVALAAFAAIPETSGEQRQYLEAKLATTRFYAEHIMPRAAGYHRCVMAGSSAIMALSEDQFIA